MVAKDKGNVETKRIIISTEVKSQNITNSLDRQRGPDDLL